LPDSDVLTLSVWCRSSDEMDAYDIDGFLNEIDTVLVHVLLILTVPSFRCYAFTQANP
jgi:hypothetical protein